MRFFLPEFDLSKFFQVYGGNRKRYATASGVVFVEDNLIVLVSFLNQMIYLIELNENTYTILDSIKINGCPDLVDYKNGIIVTSNFPSFVKYSSLTIMKLENKKIKIIKEIKLDEFNAHGITIIDDNNYLVTNTKQTTRGLYFINIDNGITRKFDNFDYFPKDIFISENRLVVSSSLSLPSTTNKVEVKNSKIYLFDFPSLTKIDEVEFYGQTDSISMNDTHGFITLQAQDEIIYFTLENDKLTIIKNIGGFSFPHGITANYNKVIVTNYGNNSFDVLSLNELIK
jgi:hypothetical protein